MGLEQFSHVWILFVFHKNGHLSYKAKVQPPRLNGAKTGVFSTRSPHRPNAIGLTLAKLEKVEGGAVYLSGIDMIHGTPVLDIKPYIADYDSPKNLMEPLGGFNPQNNQPKPETVSQSDGRTNSCDQQQLSEYDAPQLYRSIKEKSEDRICSEDRALEENYPKHNDAAKTQQPLPKCRERTTDLGVESRGHQSLNVAGEQMGPHGLETAPQEEDTDERPGSGAGAPGVQGNNVVMQPTPHPCQARSRTTGSTVPAWVREAPTAPLQVRFTPHAEMDLWQLSSGDAGHASFRYFRSTEEAKCAIEAVLSADPRSVYRRKLCQDRLFYFTVDTVHITCWFGDGFAEVLKIKPASEPAPATEPVGPQSREGLQVPPSCL
ncbi:tRNA (adenine(37)-N6)-methyltransferase isoform X2 [Cavia porcellus]